MDLLKNLPARVFPVGRLDLDTEGALLLTNDGDLALRLAHPRFGVAKVYEARVEGDPTEADLDKVRQGIFLEGRKTAPARVTVLAARPPHTTLKVEIHEGRKREIRKLFEAIGYPGRRPEARRFRRADPRGPQARPVALSADRRGPAAEEARRARSAPGRYFDPSGRPSPFSPGAANAFEALGEPLELPVDQAVDGAVRKVPSLRRRRPRRPVRISIPSSIVLTG